MSGMKLLLLEQEVRAFVQKHDITCPEAIYQNDSVVIDACEFIERLIDVVGYKKEEDEG
jgi:hypothetical protein